MSMTIEQNIQDFLRGEGNNSGLADGLLIEERIYHGPLILNADRLERCTGPEPHMRYRTEAENFERRVAGIMDRVRNGGNLFPLLVNYERGRFTINDGNHRLEAYARMGIQKIEAIVWITASDEASRSAWEAETAAFL